MGEPNGQARTSYRVAYVLCVLLGWLGAHRYYLHRWWTGILYTFSLGLLGIGVLVDLLTMPLLVRQRRDIEAGIPLPPDEAPWAKDEPKTWWNFFQLLLRFGILVFLPALTIVIAKSLGQPVIIALVFVLLAFSLLLGSIGRGLYALEDMQSLTEKVPLLTAVIRIIGRFHDHYASHRARSVFFYLLYPLLGPLFMLFSSTARREFRPFLSLFSIVVFGIIFQNVLNYLNVFPVAYFSHDWQFGLTTCLLLAAVGIVLFFLCVVPIVSSSFYLSMTGRGLSLRASAALALVISGAAVFLASRATSVTFRGSLTAMEKMNNNDFRKDFEKLNKFFLQSELMELPDKYPQDENTVAWRAAHWAGDVEVLPEETKWYRKVLSGVLRKEEAAAFRVVAVYPPAEARPYAPWLAIQFIPDPIGVEGVMGEAVLLYVMSPTGESYGSWSELPAWFKDEAVFTLVDGGDVQTMDARVDRLTAHLLIDDLLRTRSFGDWDYTRATAASTPMQTN